MIFCIKTLKKTQTNLLSATQMEKFAVVWL